jgi:hypothetical protein
MKICLLLSAGRKIPLTALLYHVGAGVLKASDSQEKSVDAKVWSAAKSLKPTFGLKHSSLTPRQLAGIRSLIHALGLNCTNGEEQSKLRDAIETAKQLARKAEATLHYHYHQKQNYLLKLRDFLVMNS